MPYNKGRGGFCPGGSNENCVKNYFQLPKVLFNRDRYCNYCGKQVKEEWKFCRDQRCQKPTTPRYPDVGPEWSLCPKCNLSFLHNKMRFCSICHHRTPAGAKWQEKSTKLQRMVFETWEKFRNEDEEETLTVKDDDAAQTEKKLDDNTDSNIFDDESDKLFEEKMLLDEDDDKQDDSLADANN